MTACYVCGFELPDEVGCQVELHPEYLNRLGRHSGRCWGGRFPTTADLPMPKLTEEEQEDARERGRMRHQQLTIETENAA